MFSILIPGKIVAKQRPRKGKSSFYTPPKTKQYEDYVKYFVKNKMIKEGIEITNQPVRFGLMIFHKFPSKWGKSKRKFFIGQQVRRPMGNDIDNIQKTVMDALNGVFYVDDSQIFEILYVRRFYAIEEGIHILAVI